MKNIIAALIKFQSIVPKIGNDKTNPHFRNRYASLTGIIETINDSLTKCELTFSQSFHLKEGNSILVTTLFHSSGESISSELKMIELNDPQKQGSVITYFKRYSLLAILGLGSSDEDDDDAQKVVAQKTIPAQQPKSMMKISEAQKKLLGAIANRTGEKVPEFISYQQMQAWISERNQKQ